MHRLIALFTLLSTAAFAQAPAEGASTPAAPTTEVAAASSSGEHLLKPLHLDVRLAGDTDILLVYVELGAMVDVGLLPAGPGTLAVGASFDLGACGSVCWAFSALTSFNMSQTFLSPAARVSYHVDLKKLGVNSPVIDKLDAYGLVFAGPNIASWALSADDNSVKVEGTDLTFGGGLGVGGQYFFSDNFFVGAEGTFRYAKGAYNWKATVGQYSISGTENTWDHSGFNVRVNAGLRFP